MSIDPRDIDSLAQVIRQVDGNHELGAAALAERILEEWGLIYNEKCRQEYGRLEQAAEIARNLADQEAHVFAHICMDCREHVGREIGGEQDPAEHAESCVWARARRWAEEN